MAAKRLTRAEKKAATRTQLLEAAARVFARRGFGAATIEEIAEEAGFSHGAVYSNFAGKDDLFLAVFEDYMATRARELNTAASSPGGLAERARAFADRWMERFGDDRESFLLHLEFMVHAARDPELSEKMGVRQASLRVAIERHLEEAEHAGGGGLTLSAADLALVMRALGMGLAVEALNNADAVRPDLFGDFVEQVFRVITEPAGTPS